MKAGSTVVAALLLLAPARSDAALATYTQNFESMVMTDPAVLANDGWLVFGNVFTPAHVFLYPYGPFPAPNAGSAFCAVDAGQGGLEQGAQQLSIYNDYNNADHANGNLVEANVYHEQTIAAGDAGSTWEFGFDAKLGNLAGGSTAVAFIKTLDPANGYALTNFITVNATVIPATWGHFTLSLPVTAGLVGQLAQFGFASTATLYEPSGVFYDNLSWGQRTTDAPHDALGAPLALLPPAPNPFRERTRLDFTLSAPGPVDVGVFAVDGRRVATLARGEHAAGRHSVVWDGRTADGRIAPAGVYRCVLQSAAGRQARSIVHTR